MHIHDTCNLSFPFLALFSPLSLPRRMWPWSVWPMFSIEWVTSRTPQQSCNTPWRSVLSLIIIILSDVHVCVHVVVHPCPYVYTTSQKELNTHQQSAFRAVSNTSFLYPVLVICVLMHTLPLDYLGIIRLH